MGTCAADRDCPLGKVCSCLKRSCSAYVFMGAKGETTRDQCVAADCAGKRANVGISFALPDGGAMAGPLFELEDGGWERVLAEPFFRDLSR